MVAPLVGARIEIPFTQVYCYLPFVAPLVGARIEISMGLTEVDLTKVAPLVGARIEINAVFGTDLDPTGRSPRGSED